MKFLKLFFCFVILLFILSAVEAVSAHYLSHYSKNVHNEDAGKENLTVSSPAVRNSRDSTNGLYVKLTNNPNAKNPTFKKLVSFIKKDKTDQKKYVAGKYMCDYFARDVHNNAEKAGIKAGYVALTLADPSDLQYCNVFNTTDKGLIYIDCTGEPEGGVNCDCQVKKVKVGVRYHPVALYPPSERSYYQGTIKSFKTYW
jgi:hypothetical protein